MVGDSCSYIKAAAMLRPTPLYAQATFLGVNPDRAAGLETSPVEFLDLVWEGMTGDAYLGLTRPSCSRVKLQYERGTEIRNTRQITLISQEELDAVAADMGIASIDPTWIGANIVVTGLPEFSKIPPSSRLIFETGAVLTVDMRNGPCKFAAEVIDRHYPGQGLSFPAHARNRRGVTAWVERPGRIVVGDRARLHVPPQEIYAAAEVRS